MLKKVGERKFKIYARIGIALIFLITIYLGSQIPKVGFDYDFEKFFPIDDEETSYFFEHRKKFESDNDFLLIAIQREKGVFDLNFLKKIDSLTKDLKRNVPHVQFISAITNVDEQFLYPAGGSSSRPYIDFRTPDLKRDSTRIYRSKEIVNVLIAQDAKSLCIFLRHEDYISKVKSDEVIEKVQKITNGYSFEKVRIAGRTIGQQYYIDKMTYELGFFIILSAILVVIFLWVSFRSLWGIILPLLVMTAATTWLLGGMSLFRQPINIVLSTLPSIMFVVSMSDVIHLVSRYLDAYRTGIGKYESIRLAINEVGFAMFLTSLTTAIGFLTLIFVSVQPIQIFGLVMSIGVMLAFALTVVVLPFLFILTPTPKYVVKSKESPFWPKKLKKWFVLLLHNRKKVLLIYGAITVLFVIGMTFMRTNNFLMDDMRSDDPLKEDFNYLDEHYGGVRPFELVVELKDTNLTFWDEDVLSDVERVEEYLSKNYGVTIKKSLNGMIKVLNRSYHSGDPEFYSIPETQSRLRNIRRMIRLAQGGDLYNSIVDSTGTISRINGTIPDWGNMKVTQKNKELLSYLKKTKFKSDLEFKITGTAHLFDKNLRYLSVSLVQGLLVSMAVIAVIMMLIYRSWSMLIISLVPNIFPLIVIAGIMGFMGIELKTSTAIIFTIAFGIAVDDTIHLLGKFKFELMKGKTVPYALKRAYLTTGKAMVLTTLVLCSGFLLLVFSSFMGTVYMGLLLCITLFVALIADLTLLPILILLFYKDKRKLNK